tara:strand:+ start:1963 stop:2223 length:261 start_codon:yes stop_codon:yes gene_type:complete
MKEVDSGFYDRADAHIHLSNDQINEKASSGKVSASSMYATARFNVWVSACGMNSAAEMESSKQLNSRYHQLLTINTGSTPLQSETG